MKLHTYLIWWAWLLTILEYIFLFIFDNYYGIAFGIVAITCYLILFAVKGGIEL